MHVWLCMQTLAQPVVQAAMWDELGWWHHTLHITQCCAWLGHDWLGERHLLGLAFPLSLHGLFAAAAGLMHALV